MLSQPGESAVVGRGRPAIEQSGAGKHGSPRADRRHEVHLPVHPLHPVEQRGDPLGLGLRVEERPGSTAAGVIRTSRGSSAAWSMSKSGRTTGPLALFTASRPHPISVTAKR